MKVCELGHHHFIPLTLVRVNSLRVLPEVVQTREGLATVAAERSLASVLPDVPSQMLASGKGHVAISETAALEDGGWCGPISIDGSSVAVLTLGYDLGTAAKSVIFASEGALTLSGLSTTRWRARR